MKLVVDTNVLFSFFKKDSFTRKFIILNKGMELISPELSLEELNKYANELLFKSKLTKNKLEEALLLLRSYVKFMPETEYKAQLKDAEALAGHFSAEDAGEFMEDIDFFALALKENCSIWSNDKLFRKQSSIVVFNTAELAKSFDSIFA